MLTLSVTIVIFVHFLENKLSEMESISLQQKEIAKDLLEQIRGAIDNFILKNPELPSNSGDFL